MPLNTAACHSIPRYAMACQRMLWHAISIASEFAEIAAVFSGMQWKSAACCRMQLPTAADRSIAWNVAVTISGFFILVVISIRGKSKDIDVPFLEYLTMADIRKFYILTYSKQHYFCNFLATTMKVFES